MGICSSCSCGDISLVFENVALLLASRYDPSVPFLALPALD